MSDIPGYIFKYIEGELYDLQHNKKKLKDLKEDIATNSMGVSYEGGSAKSNDFHSKTEDSAVKILSNRVVIRLEETIRNIENGLCKLDDDELELYYKKYRQKKDWKGITSEMNISRATFFRWRKKVVKSIGQELGLVEKD